MMKQKPLTPTKINTKVQNLYKKIESLIAGIAEQPVEVAVLSKGTYISIVMDGNQAVACDKLRNFFGVSFDAWEYDEELDATYAGIKLN